MSRYAESHKSSSLAGPGDARPTALQIIRDENLVGKLNDKVFLVTGVSSGIGIETLRALYVTGAHVYGTVRNAEKGQKVVDEITAKEPQGGKITLIQMELDSLEAIKEGAKSFLQKSGGKLNVLINNAGIMAVPFSKTKDGFESQLGTNHIGHFLLFQLLKKALLSSATPDFPSRVVSVSSTGHRFGPVRFHDLNFDKGDYNDWSSYGQSKTANIWFANYIERHYGSRHLHATSLHPGAIPFTNLGNHVDQEQFKSYDTPEYRAYMKNAEQGAATQVYAAVSEEWKDKGGKYLSNCAVQEAYGTTGVHPSHDDGFEKWAYDVEGEEKLWEESLKIVGLPQEK
ncbi:WW domain-containing oxidoreductase [Periconia macrospinosa]|uniref:WW domain-containing oxidoreductase n=1 Tax=Periconia macrospinosa TaxID=97972 RepID=A0A2V1DWN2_9PLEO|nr:WW domain-containing oxidoreductase [Periconia macrospinosa]